MMWVIIIVIIGVFHFTPEDLKQIGKSIYKEKYRFKKQEGFSLNNLNIPERIFETIPPTGQLEKDFINDTLQEVRNIIE